MGPGMKDTIIVSQFNELFFFSQKVQKMKNLNRPKKVTKKTSVQFMTLVVILAISNPKSMVSFLHSFFPLYLQLPSSL